MVVLGFQHVDRLFGNYPAVAELLNNSFDRPGEALELSRLAQEFAAEINNPDWSDAPYRRDRSGHRREHDGHRATSRQLDRDETEAVVPTSCG